MVNFSAQAVLFALALSFLSSPVVYAAGQFGKTLQVVTQASGDGPNAKVGQTVSGLVMAALTQRGHEVLDGNQTASVPGAVILRVTAESPIHKGDYTTQASVGLRAVLVDGDSKRHLAQFDLGTGVQWRVAANCAQSCIDQEFKRRVGPLVEQLAKFVDRCLAKLGRNRKIAAVNQTRIAVLFQRLDRALLPQVQQYLQNFPGVTRVRRDHTVGDGVLYRLDQIRSAGATDLSLKKMLHHLQLRARIARTGNSFVVEADPTAQPTAASLDW
jgi:hypothetical protein